VVWISITVLMGAFGVAIAAVGLAQGVSNAPIVMTISVVGLALAAAMIIAALIQRRRRR
jgi:drug/metabolite transporter (DMT)-like permease